MKTIYLVRHAKAEEKTTADKDFDRALTAEGINDAEKMGKRLASMRIQPDIIITSPAERALQTAKIIQENIKYEGEVIVNENFYSDYANKIINHISRTEENIHSLMLVGHNPSFNGLLRYLCDTNIDTIPKSGIVGIKLKADKWANISRKCGVLLFFDSPKNR